MGCGSSSTADPKSGKPQNQTSTREQENRVNPTISRVKDRDVPNSHIKQTRLSVQKSTVDREKKVTPPKHRDLKLNLEDFQQIDEHARKAPSSVEESVDTLAEYLAKPAQNDLEKVRALYVWIGENIRYNTDAYFSGDFSSVASNGEDVLKCKSSVCEGYARLFEALCLSLGITCKKISGYAKGYGHNAGDVISYDTETNHAWNVVELDGTWQFIETTWGAGHTDKNKKFNKEFNNFFFLTPPHNFITDHFPYMNNNIEDSKQWQLLENPLTLELFSKSIKPSPQARHFGIEFPNHPYDMITVKISCTITVESKADVLLGVLCVLYDDHGSTCDESIIVLKENNCKYRVTVRPRRKGRYELHVYGNIDKSNCYPQLVAYLIDCVSVETEFMAYPTNRGYYGPQLDYIQRGFHTPDVVQPFHMCKNGEFELEVKTAATPKITTAMFDGDGTDQEDYTLVEQTDDTIYIRARFTKKGYYKLTIFSEFGEPDEFTEALILLIFNSNESATTSPFPLTYSSTREYNCRLLEPLVRDIPANSEVQFQFTSPYLTELLVNNKVHTKENGDVWRIVTETGDSGNLELSGNPSDGNSYSTVYEFVIKS